MASVQDWTDRPPVVALFARDEQDGHPAACRGTKLAKPAQVIARAGGDQRRTVINGQHDLKSLHGTDTDCLLECQPAGAAVRRTPTRAIPASRPAGSTDGLPSIGLLTMAKRRARVSRLGECTAEHQRLAHPGRCAQDREPMPGLDGMNQPRDGLLMPRHRDIGATALDKGIPVQSPVIDPTHASPLPEDCQASPRRGALHSARRRARASRTFPTIG